MKIRPGTVIRDIDFKANSTSPTNYIQQYLENSNREMSQAFSHQDIYKNNLAVIPEEGEITEKKFQNHIHNFTKKILHNTQLLNKDNNIISLINLKNSIESDPDLKKTNWVSATSKEQFKIIAHSLVTFLLDDQLIKEDKPSPSYDFNFRSGLSSAIKPIIVSSLSPSLTQNIETSSNDVEDKAFEADLGKEARYFFKNNFAKNGEYTFEFVIPKQYRNSVTKNIEFRSDDCTGMSWLKPAAQKHKHRFKVKVNGPEYEVSTLDNEKNIPLPKGSSQGKDRGLKFKVNLNMNKVYFQTKEATDLETLVYDFLDRGLISMGVAITKGSRTTDTYEHEENKTIEKQNGTKNTNNQESNIYTPLERKIIRNTLNLYLAN